MRCSEKTFLKLLEHLYEGAISSGLWQPFLDSIASDTKAGKAGIHMHEFSEADTSKHVKGQIVFRVGYSEEELRLYNSHFALTDPYVDRIRSRFPGQLSIGTTENLFTKEELERNTYYKDYGRKSEIFHITWVVLENNDVHGSGLSLLRGADREPFDADTAKLLCALAPHMRRTLLMQRKLAALKAESSANRHALDSFGVALMGISESTRIVGMTAAARRFLQPEHGLNFKNGFIKAVDPAQNSRLQSLILGAIATAEGRGLQFATKVQSLANNSLGTVAWTAPSGGSVTITRSSLAPLRILVTPFAGQELTFCQRPMALLFLYDIEASPPSRSAILRTAYGLTPAECRLSHLLLSGYTLKTCSELLGYTFESTRFLLKLIFGKTGIRRQPELIRMFLSLPGQLDE